MLYEVITELDEEDYTIGPSANYDMRLDFDIEIACAAKTEEEAGKNRDILVKAIGDKLSAADIPGIEYLSISAPKQNSRITSYNVCYTKLLR